MPREHTQPRPPNSWDAAPDHLTDDAAFAELDKGAQRYVCLHWRWAITHGQLHGHDLVGHHNWLKWCHAEDRAWADRVSGVFLNGEPVDRAAW